MSAGLMLAVRGGISNGAAVTVFVLVVTVIT
jgi:hypothetical protein